MNRMILLAAVSLGALAAQPASAQPLSLRDSFNIGSGSGLLCTAQVSALDAAYGDMFDRGYSITCRDADAAVGQLYALRLRGGDPAARLARLRAERVDCPTSERVEIEGAGTTTLLNCRWRSADVGHRAYLVRRGDTLYVAEGLAGYDSALRLGLRSLIADRPVPGEVAVATTGAGDPAAFARAQAGSLDPRRALLEAYRRNNAGSYAEAAEFFGSLNEIEENATRAEALVNQGLQSSNLGRYAEAEAEFARAAALAGDDPVLRRRLRNYVALHLLNQGEAAGALAELDRPMTGRAGSGAAQAPVIDRLASDRLNAEASGRTSIDAASGTLRPAEKIQILDAQAQQLRGTILRLQGRGEEAVPILRQAFTDLQGVRGGVVASTVWMRAQILQELASIAEAGQQPAESERLLRESVALLEVDYPGSAALLSAQARLAHYLARSGQAQAARDLYRTIIAANVEAGTGSSVVRRSLEPYFELLTAADAGPDAAADLFLASQVAMRPGVAQTQAVLARELSAGSDEGSRLFRQAVALTRDVERTRVEISRLRAGEQSAEAVAAIAAAETRLEEYRQVQAATQARLADFPRYRAVATNALPLAELQQLLRPGEAYYKMIVLGGSSYAVMATPTSARAFRLGTTPLQLDEAVDGLRATISLVEDGDILTYPFDVETAHGLYRTLFGPVASELGGVRHLIFEGDGAMLRLPPNLLVEDEAGVETYRRRAAQPGADVFDFTGIAWFGRDRDISTSVAPLAFRDVRQLAPSRAANQYLGFGENAPASGLTLASLNVRGGEGGPECSWALTAWNRPIPDDELITASRALSGPDGGATDIVTGADFTDTAIKQRGDLDQFRVMHFATHGLVTPPRPECPSRPSLLTSFGGPESDGLLSFREIFDLRLDADLIILSACDTAGRADFTATEEVGLTSGGDFALDGLVRAFVGAGGRLVVASHWPVPDAYEATERLISGLFTAAPGTGTASALRQSQHRLMDEPATSHPYYWAGFAVIGDGTNPVVPAAPVRTAARD
ncbi:CHAT domain-containing protein [Sphingosinicella sp. YJ22]|uniref:CHAT domain-containing protein n=1 Tax=Sphingosinicella sp. YJ22 TaxID=1104780 RepID=UPI001FAFC6DB|nr:CHAT domain-containing protein [Sphingosinicella sp. YJ22]